MFNEIIIDNFCNPDHQGRLTLPDIQLQLGDPVCGDKVDIDLSLDQDGYIQEARFRAWGCTTSLAMSNQFCRYVQGKKTAEAARLPPEKIALLLGDELQPSQQHCLNMLQILFRQLGEKI